MWKKSVRFVSRYLAIGVLIGVGIYVVDEIHWRFFGSERLEIVQQSLDDLKKSYHFFGLAPFDGHSEETRPGARPSCDSASAPDLLLPTPYFVDGEIKGYRVYPGPDPKVFRSLGLKPGDLVTEIDGQPLNRTEVATELFGKAVSGQSVQFGVLRGNELELIDVKID